MSDPIPTGDLVWNRACDPFAPFTHGGDRALAALLLCHGMAMNGGLLHACQGLDPDQRDRAVAGYRLFGLVAAAGAVDDIARRAAALSEDDPEAGDRLEAEANRRYDAALPEWDETIDAAFREYLAAHPEAFAPLET